MHSEWPGQASGRLLPRPHQNHNYTRQWRTVQNCNQKSQQTKLIRNFYYILLTCTRVVSSLAAASTASLRRFAYFNKRSLLNLLLIAARSKLLQSCQLKSFTNYKGLFLLYTLSFMRFLLRSYFVSYFKFSVALSY